MKKKIMKIMGVGIASLTAMTTAVPVLAAAPTADDSNTITVQGVAEADTSAVVKIYRVVEPVYGKEGLVKYKTVDGITIADIEKPTSSEVAKAVSAILANPESYKSYQLDRNTDGEFVKDGVAPGEYIAIVSGTNTTVYNPAVVSVNYTDANNADSTTAGSVNLGTAFKYGDVAYMKSSTPSIDKNIVVGSELVKGDTVDAGGTNTTAADEITFQIDSQLPSYEMSNVDGAKLVYKNPVFRISDKLDTTFANITELKVMNAAGADLVKDQDYVIEAGGVGSTNFTIKFTEDYLLNNGNQSIKVVYKTALNDTKDNNNYAENLNVAKLEYSNDPTNSDSVKTVKAKTYHYTFSIDGIIDGQTVTDGGTYNTASGKNETHEINKVTQKITDTTTEWKETVKAGDITTQSSKYALKDAEFTLYGSLTEGELADPIATSKSDEVGHIPFTGLDEGTYYMKETNAPSGYTLNDNIYKIVIDATLDDEGVLESYTVTTSVSTDEGANFTPAGNITYKNTKRVNNNVADENFGRVVNTIVSEHDAPTEIIDTKLAELPATGGVGTAVFTIAGIALVCGFTSVGIANRKKKED